MNDSAWDVLSEGQTWAVEAADCRKGLAALPAHCVHAACTSPPYWRHRDYQHADQIGDEQTLAAYINSLVAVGRELHRVLRRDGAWWLNLGDTYAGGELELVPWRVAMALQADGWILRQQVTWCKRSPMPGSPGGKCTAATEPVFMFTQSNDYYYDHLADPRKLSEGTEAELMKLHGRTGAGGNLFNWWDDIETENNSAKHFAPYPLALARRCLKLTTSAYGVCSLCGKPWTRVVARDRRATRPGRTSKADGVSAKTAGHRDRGRHVTLTETTGWQAACDCNNPLTVPPLVLDPFSGSGTTIRAAVAIGARAIGYELNESFAAESRDYIRQRLKQKPKKPKEKRP